MNLSELALHYGTDKCPEWRGNTGHAYTPFYEDLLKDKLITKVLEIGISANGTLLAPSLRMWADYFPEAEVYGLDIVPWVMVNEGRIHSVLCDASDAEDLGKVALSLCPDGTRFDLIVDDGSHVPDHQVIAANTLMPFLNRGGFYIIEDVQKDQEYEVQNRILYPSIIVTPSSSIAPRRPDDTLILMEGR